MLESVELIVETIWYMKLPHLAADAQPEKVNEGVIRDWVVGDKFQLVKIIEV